MLKIGDEPVGVTFAWKKQGHLRVGGIKRVGRRNVAVPVELNESGYRWLVIVVERLWLDLDSYLTDAEKRIQAGTTLNRAALWPIKGPIQGPAAAEWQAFLDSRTEHVKHREGA